MTLLMLTAQIKFCAFTVAKHHGNPIEVARLCEALDWAHYSMLGLTEGNIKYIANVVCPEVNDWRKIEIPFVSATDKIEGHINQLLEAWEAGRLDPRHLYWEFCAIHPFGSNVNSYVGVILYNWSNHSCGRPTMPPAYLMNEDN